MNSLKVVRVTANYPGAIRVDRGTHWGNPFIMVDETQRHEVCDKFAQYARWRLSIEPAWLLPLKGKVLACWCSPKRCHAETLWELANTTKEDQ